MANDKKISELTELTDPTKVGFFPSTVTSDPTANGKVSPGTTLQAGLTTVTDGTGSAAKVLGKDGSNAVGWFSPGVSSIAATSVTYDNSIAGLDATDAQGAIDEVAGLIQNLAGTDVSFDNTTPNVGLTATTLQGAVDEIVLQKIVPPSIASTSVAGILKVDGTTTTITNQVLSVPIATSTTPGLSTVGHALAIDNTTPFKLNVVETDLVYINTTSLLTATTFQGAIDELAVKVNSPINALLYVDPINGVDKETGGGELDPLKTLTFAQGELPAAGGTIILVGHATESFTQSIDNVTIQGTGTQWSPASFITGTITQPTGRQRLRLKDIQVAGNIEIKGIGNNYFENLNGGTCVFDGSSGYNEFWQCEASAKTITNHTGMINSILCRNLNVTISSGTATYIAQFCQNGGVTMQIAGTVFLNRCNSVNASHLAGALLVDRCGGFALSSTADATAGNVIKILASDFINPTDPTVPVGYYAFGKTGACPMITDAITKYPSGTTTVQGLLPLVDTHTPTAA